jgi:hypothetical protein
LLIIVFLSFIFWSITASYFSCSIFKVLLFDLLYPVLILILFYHIFISNNVNFAQSIYHIFQHCIKKNNINFPHRHQTYGYEWSYFLQKSQFLLPKHQQIFPRWKLTKLDIVLSEFCPDICPWADIVVTLPVFNMW